MKNKCDLLIHYDEQNQRFIFYSVNVKDTAAIRSETFDGVRPEVAFFKEKTPDEAERAMGSMVFSLLDLSAVNMVNIRDYKAESEAAMRVSIAELEIAAKDGDAEAQCALFHQIYSRSRQLSELQRAEDLLLMSVAGDCESAKEVLKNWSLLKEAAERRIQRDSNSSDSKI